MGRNFDDNSNWNSNSGDDEYRIPGISDKEIAALEAERTVMDETEVQMAQRMLRENLVPAIKSLTQLALKSPNERIRMAAAQSVIERCMGRVQDTPPAPADDPLTALLGEVVTDVAAKEVAEVGVAIAHGEIDEPEGDN